MPLDLSVSVSGLFSPVGSVLGSVFITEAARKRFAVGGIAGLGSMWDCGKEFLL